MDFHTWLRIHQFLGRVMWLFSPLVEKDVAKLLKGYFDTYGKFSSESDIKRLETVLT